jgi:hypothetical protein
MSAGEELFFFSRSFYIEPSYIGLDVAPQMTVRANLSCTPYPAASKFGNGRPGHSHIATMSLLTV